MIRKLTRFLTVAIIAGVLASASIVAADVSSATDPRPRTDLTRIDLRRGTVVVRTARDLTELTAPERAAADPDGHLFVAARSRAVHRRAEATFLAVTAGDVRITKGPTVSAGQEVLVYGNRGPNPPRVRWLKPLRPETFLRLQNIAAGGAMPGRISAPDRVAIGRLNGRAAALIRLLDANGLRLLASPDCRVGSRPIDDFTDLLQDFSAVVSAVDVSYVMHQLSAAGPNKATARFVMTLGIRPRLLESFLATVAASGEVQYRKDGSQWRIAGAEITSSNVDTRRLPGEFVRLRDLMLPNGT